MKDRIIMIENKLPIPLNEIYDYPDLERITLEDRRYYVSPEGDNLDSVTTILSKTSDNSFLLEWKKRIGEEEAARQTSYATGLGTLMHEHLENYVQGIPRPKGTSIVWRQAEKMADQIIKRGLPNIDEIFGMEKILYYPKLFAGTSDLICSHKGEMCISDYKTAKKIKSIEHMENYFCQLCSYAMAHNELFGTKIRKGVIFMASRDYEFKEYIIEGNTFDIYYDKWLERLDTFYSK